MAIFSNIKAVDMNPSYLVKRRRRRILPHLYAMSDKKSGLTVLPVFRFPLLTFVR